MHSVLSIALVTAAVTLAQTSASAPKRSTTDTLHLTVTTSTSGAIVAPGGRVSLFVDIALKPKMHVYAPEEKVNMPISLQVDRTSTVTVRPPIFPKGESFVFAPTGETQIVYSRPFRIEVPVTTARTQKAGVFVLSGTFRYQACDDQVCYIAKSVRLTWEVTIR